ncbi:hypothetical protein MIND_00584500 [Mycena indigotica]|uniref:Uncharacterized protein n=1 Tax=Mycena indigotica TaxID=2126181 RepID=A0A8H6SSG0_9AGAR|nr:uncharacterized protein MIND_00584500 [Mycena indigotica]KAF7303552.1 hypothetical protein MIND_00584500 [Mycena indigotica]
MDNDPHSKFPTPGLQFLSAFIHFFGVTLLACFISQRLRGRFLTREWWIRLSWARLCVLIVLIDSYLFMLSTGLLIFGVGMQRNHYACAAGIYLCVTFYTMSKVFMYLFLSEKVFIVWAEHKMRRTRCPVYLVCVGTIGLYVAIIVAMYFGRIAEFRAGDGACEIGLKPTASLPLVAYDLVINVLLTSLFLWPVLRFRLANARLKRVAVRTLVAAIAALTTSTVNIAVLTILNGRELGWLCLASCGSDVVLNATAIFWVTRTIASDSQFPTLTVDPRLASDEESGPGPSRRSSTMASRPPSMGQRPMSALVPFHVLPHRPVPQDVQVRVTTVSETATSPPETTSPRPSTSTGRPASGRANSGSTMDWEGKRHSAVSTATRRTDETRVATVEEKMEDVDVD